MSDLNPARIAPANRLDALQAGRAVAAITVVLYHANNFILPDRIYDGATLWSGFGMGYAGVEFFFVLSGFIMPHVHRRDLNKPSRVLPFLRKRVTRIYPIYWVVLIALVAIYQIGRDFGPDFLRDPRVIFQSFLLLPSETRPILPVAWTLQHEMFFYLLFAVLVFDRRVGLALLTLWFGACLWQITRPSTAFPQTFLLSPYNLLFGIGIFVALREKAVPRTRATALLIFGIAGFLFVGMTEAYLWSWSLPLRTLAYGIFAAALVTALARADFKVPDAAVFLGNASYAIYLIHLPAMNIAAILLTHTEHFNALPMIIIFTLLVATVILAGCAPHVLIRQYRKLVSA